MITADVGGNPGADVRHPARSPLRRAPLGLLPAPTDAMTDGAATEQPHELSGHLASLVPARRSRRGRLACLVPPLSSAARRTSTPRRSVLAPRHRGSRLGGPGRPVAPPEARAGRVARPPRPASTGWPTDGGATGSCPGHSPSSPRISVAVVAWHAPGAVAAVAQHGWLVPLEGVTLLVFGLGLWLELVTSPPLVPRSGYLRRAVLAGLRHVGVLDPRLRGGPVQPRLLPQLPPRAAVVSARPPTSRSPPRCCGSWPPPCFVPVIFWNAMHVAPDRRGPRRRAPGAGAGRAAAGTPPLARAAGRRRLERPGTPLSRRSFPPTAGRSTGGRWVSRSRSAALLLRQGSAAVRGQPGLLSRQAVQRRGVAGVVHERLHVLDRPQGVRGRPQRGGRHHLTQLLAGGCPGAPGCWPGRRCPRW